MYLGQRFLHGNIFGTYIGNADFKLSHIRKVLVIRIRRFAKLCSALLIPYNGRTFILVNGVIQNCIHYYYCHAIRGDYNG